MRILIRCCVVLGLFSLTSCGLAKSALQLPGSILQTVGRTAGLSVNHVEEVEEQEGASRFD